MLESEKFDLEFSPFHMFIFYLPRALFIPFQECKEFNVRSKRIPISLHFEVKYTILLEVKRYCSENDP